MLSSIFRLNGFYSRTRSGSALQQLLDNEIDSLMDTERVDLLQNNVQNFIQCFIIFIPSGRLYLWFVLRENFVWKV